MTLHRLGRGRARRRAPAVLPALALVALLLGAAACDSDTDDMLKAKVVTDRNELIGGPAAKAKPGDFLIANDQVRFIVAGEGPSYAAGMFGGTLIDIDLHRWRADERNGAGWDSFSDTFPLVNLIAPNPSNPLLDVMFGEDGLQIETGISEVAVAKDGSDGEAIIRVKGNVGYMFDTFKFFDRDFLEGLVDEMIVQPLNDPDAGGGLLALIPESFQGLLTALLMQCDNDVFCVVKNFLDVDLRGLLNRLQLSFDFTTDYILHPGERYLTMRTKVRANPPSENLMADCPETACDLTAADCPNGFVMQEMTETAGNKELATHLCPICECADEKESMPTFNEGLDFFKVMLGDLPEWKNPLWKGGIVAGDFLFFGSEAHVFAPGFGFDYDGKIYDNLYQDVGTMGSPFIFDWIAGIGQNVSYALTSVNPDEADGVDCPTWELVITRIAPEQEDALVTYLAESLPEEDRYEQRLASTKVRNLVVDHRPVLVKSYDWPDPGEDAGNREAVLSSWQDDLLTGELATGLTTAFGDDIALGLKRTHDCLPSQLLMPLFSTSATASFSHFDESGFEDNGEGVYEDRTRAFTFERYFAVGDGDVGSVLKTIYKLRETPHGYVRGLVFEEGSVKPVPKAQVFVLRPLPDGSVPATYAEYRVKAKEAFGDPGLVAFYQADVGTDPVLDGRYGGPLQTGDFLLVAHTSDRGTSAPVAVTMTEGRTETVNLPLTAPAGIEYTVQDNGGVLIPCMLTFQPVDEDGEPLRWRGTNYPELGDSRYDHGVTKIVNSAGGSGTVTVPPGRYDITISRGFEYAVEKLEDVTLRPAETRPIEAVLNREMDTQGYLSGDLHIHTQASTDSSLQYEERMRAAAAQGLEVAIATDHDHLVDYIPFINELGLQQFLNAQVGCETSPLELGHTNSWPLEYDHREGPIHDPPPWSGRTLIESILEMLARAAVHEHEFIIQTNHPRDGFLGYFSQVGMTTYDLQRATPMMEMCNPALVEAPCSFQSMELMNGKHFEYLWTPTIGEVFWFNDCVEQIYGARTKDVFDFDSLGEGAICGYLQQGPDGCANAAAAAAEAGLDDDERAARIRLRDHCTWHERFRDEVAQCQDAGMNLVECKRWAVEASRNLMVRYMMERTPEENAAFLATTVETDLGCDYEAAMAGCEAITDGEGAHTAGCGDDCFCADCVCASMPECCVAEGATDGEGDEAVVGTGWTAACAALCESGCHGCGVQPCTDRLQPFDDWFAFLNAGYDITAVANSDSHTVTNQIGLPRNFVKTSTDRPYEVDLHEFNHSVIEGRVLSSSGAFIDFSLSTAGGETAEVADTIAATSGDLTAHIRVQTPSWYRVDRVEIYRNGQQEKVLFVEPEGDVEDAKRKIVDFDQDVVLPRPDEDSWYVVFAYGFNDPLPMAPVYKRKPYGSMLFSQIIALAADQLFSSLGGVIGEAENLYPGATELVEGLLGAIVLPESADVFPLAITNAIKVDIDGGGYWPVNGVDADGDELPDLPPFCSRDCAPDASDPQSTCGLNQTCVAVDDDDNVLGGRCMIPIPDYCVGRQPVGGFSAE